MLAFVAVFVSIAREADFVHLDWRVECDCCRRQAMRHTIGMLLLSFSMCIHDTAGNIIWHILFSGVDNDDFVTILVKWFTCLLKCYDQCIGVCLKPLLNAWPLVVMLENGILPRKHACLILRDDPGNFRSRHSPLGEDTLIAQIEGPTIHLQLYIMLLGILVESNYWEKVLRFGNGEKFISKLSIESWVFHSTFIISRMFTGSQRA